MVGRALEQGYEPYLAPSRKNMSIILGLELAGAVALGMGSHRIAWCGEPGPLSQEREKH